MSTRSSDSVNLFVYGTLTDKTLLRRLTGKAFPACPAYLEHFRKWSPPGGYPYILPEQGARVEGLLLRGIDPGSLRSLDRYEDEGRLYFRRPVTVVAEERTVACHAYVGNPAAHIPGSR